MSKIGSIKIINISMDPLNISKKSEAHTIMLTEKGTGYSGGKTSFASKIHPLKARNELLVEKSTLPKCFLLRLPVNG